MNRTTPLLSILFLSIFISCKKIDNDEADATIYVKEYQTETPIANAMVLVTRGRPGAGVGSTVVDTLYTDSNGKAGYSKTLDEDYMYYAEAYKDTYFDTHNNQVSVTLGKKNFSTTIYMYAYSYVKLHVKNVNPFNEFDVIKFNSGCNTYTFQGIIDSTFLWCDNCNCAWFAIIFLKVALLLLETLSPLHTVFPFYLYRMTQLQ